MSSLADREESIGDLKYEYTRFRRKHDPTWQSINDGAFVASKVVTVPGSGSVDIGIEVAEGKALVVFESRVGLTEGGYNIDLYDGSFTSGSGTAMVVSHLNDAYTGSSPESSFRTGVTGVTTSALLEEAYIDVGQQSGTNRLAGGNSADKIVRRFTKDKILRISKDTSDGTATVFYVAWEEEL